MRSTADALLRIRDLAGSLARAGAVLSGEAAAHVHLAAATGSRPGGPPGYLALPPQRIEALFPGEERAVSGVEAARGAVAEILRGRPDLFATTVTLAGGPRVPVLRREAVLAELLAQGGLALGLAGLVVRLASDPPIDVDEVREILKAARCGESFQPLLELIDVA